MPPKAPHASDRQHQWPRYAGQARTRTEEAAQAYAELLRDKVLPMLEQIQTAAHTDPELVEQLAILAQRDIALTIAALADIRSWMVDAARGRQQEDTS